MLLKTARVLFLISGVFFTALGVVGIFLPLLPTTPFLIVAAFCFSRSSPKLHAYLWNHPVLGPPLKNWEKEGAISLRAKILATLLIAASFSYVLIFRIENLYGRLGMALMGISLLVFILTRPEPRETSRSD